MKISLNQKELDAVYNAADQARNLIENGAEGESLRSLQRDLKHLNQIAAKARASRDRMRRA